MQKAIEIESNKSTLRGMLHIPKGKREKLPIVVIYHGFCGNKMGPHFMFVKLSRELEELGIASIRVDFAGSGESDGSFKDMTFTREVNDANAILNYVKSLEFIDKDRIAILGFSMGGAIASVIAGTRREEVRSLCLWSPAGNMEEIILSETYVGNKLDKVRKEGSFDVEGLLLGTEFLDDIEGANIYKLAEGYNKKALIIHGNKDEVVPLRASKIYEDIYGENSKLIIIDDADHIYENNIWERELVTFTKEYFKEELA